MDIAQIIVTIAFGAIFGIVFGWLGSLVKRGKENDLHASFALLVVIAFLGIIGATVRDSVTLAVCFVTLSVVVAFATYRLFLKRK